jgi:hypothetical protein
MGITLNQYRLSIGRFGGGNARVKVHIPYISKTYSEEWCFHGSREWARILHKRKISLKTQFCSNVIFVIGISVMFQSLILLCGDIEQNPGPIIESDISICHAI